MRLLLLTAAVALLATACTADDDSPPPDSRPPLPGPVDGTWSLTWECESGCDGQRPVYQREQLKAAGLVLVYSVDFAGGDDIVERGDLDAEHGCVHVAATAGDVRHNEYWVCPSPSGVVTRIIWFVDGALTQWRILGTR